MLNLRNFIKPAQQPISRATGGRSARSDHPSRKHDVERGPIPPPGQHVHSAPVRISYNGVDVLWQPRRRERRHLGGDRKVSRRFTEYFMDMAREAG